MVEFTASHFDELCRQGPVDSQIRTIETNRKSAVGRFWLFLLGGLALSVALGFAIGGASFEFGMLVFLLLAVVTVVVATRPLGEASRGIKHPVLETLAAQAGMSFTPDNFEPPVFGAAQKPLFGSWLSGAAFSDLFYGTDEQGRNFAFYEATLSRGHGKHRRTVFTGQIYAFQRRNRHSGETVAVPDRGLFNFFKPSGGFGRVKFPADPEFEKKFEVYATDDPAASMLLGGATLRRVLLDIRGQGRVFVYVGPEDVLVAVQGKNRFEPGSMLRARSGEDRVRLMFDDVCAALGVLKQLRASLG